MISEQPYKLDAEIAERIFNFTILWIDDLALGLEPHIVDPTAVRTGPHRTTASLIGGSWEKARTVDGGTIEFFGRIVPPYSTDIRWAWDVVDHLLSQGWNYEAYSTEDGSHAWTFGRGRRSFDDQWDEQAQIFHTSLPTAICLAAISCKETH